MNITIILVNVATLHLVNYSLTRNAIRASVATVASLRTAAPCVEILMVTSAICQSSAVEGALLLVFHI